MRIHMPGMDMTLEAAADLSTHQFKFFIAARPAMRMTKLTTSARTGRLMNKSVNPFIGI